MKRRVCFAGALIFSLVGCLMSPKIRGYESGPYRGDYLGRSSGGGYPELFFPPELRAEADRHSAAVFSPDMNELYWVESNGGKGRLFHMIRRDDAWTKPAPFPVAGRLFDCDDPVFSPDGSYFYFTSHRPHVTALNGREKIWRVPTGGGRWGRPKPLPSQVNGLDLHWQFSVAADYSLCIGARNPRGDTDLYWVPYEGGIYQEPYRLGDGVNTAENEATPYVDPDGRFLLFSRYGSAPHVDLYVSIRLDDGGWSPALSLGADINTSGHEMCPVVSPDGRYLFFLGTRGEVSDVWWVEVDAFLSGIR